MVFDTAPKPYTELQMNTELNVAQARDHFPALTNSNFIFADNAGGSQVPKLVVDRIADFMLTSYVQLGASYSVSKLAARRVQAGVEAASFFVNAAHPSEIVLGPSSTAVLQNLARALESDFKPSGEIIITNCDHEANIGPWVRLAEKRKLTVKIWKVDMDSMELRLDDLAKLLSPNTRLVAVTHCSNILGNIIDVQKIAEMVHTIPGAEICVDGVAFAPHRLIDVQQWNVDYYAFSWYKVFGPHMALLYTNSRTFPRLACLNHYFLTANPAKLQPGGVNYEGTHSLPGICTYLQSLSLPPSSPLPQTLSRELLSNSFHLITEHEAKLCSILLQYLLAYPETYTLFGRKNWKPAERVATVAFTVKNRSSQDVVMAMDAENRDVPTLEEDGEQKVTKDGERGIGMKWGNFHAHAFCEEYFGDKKADGVVRLSFVHYNTVEEVEYVVKTLDRVVRKDVDRLL